MAVLSRILARLRRPRQAEALPSFPFPAFPKLSATQVAVACVETWTGIPLNLDGQRHRLAGGEVYRVFDSLAQARAFAERAVEENRQIDCVLFDSAGQEIGEIRPVWVREGRDNPPFERTGRER